MSSVVIDIFVNNSSESPLSPNMSFTPTISTGTRLFFELCSATALPNPPIMEWSSAVTMHPHFLLHVSIKSPSNGLIAVSYTHLTLPTILLV